MGVRQRHPGCCCCALPFANPLYDNDNAAISVTIRKALAHSLPDWQSSWKLPLQVYRPDHQVEQIHSQGTPAKSELPVRPAFQAVRRHRSRPKDYHAMRRCGRNGEKHARDHLEAQVDQVMPFRDQIDPQRARSRQTRAWHCQAPSCSSNTIRRMARNTCRCNPGQSIVSWQYFTFLRFQRKATRGSVHAGAGLAHALWHELGHVTRPVQLERTHTKAPL